MGDLELADLARHRAGERAALMAKELALQDVVGDGTAIDRQEALVDARAVDVDGVGDQLLAGAALADDQHARAGRCHHLHLFEEVLHGRPSCR